MLKATKAIAKTCHKNQKIKSQITGGYDSRVALALSLATKTSDKFSFSVIGLNDKDWYKNSSDVKTVKLLADAFPDIDINLTSLYKFWNIKDDEEFINDFSQVINLSAATLDATYLNRFTCSNIVRTKPTFELSGRLGESWKPNMSNEVRSISGLNYKLDLERKNFHIIDNHQFLNPSYLPAFKENIVKWFYDCPLAYDLDIYSGLTWNLQHHGAGPVWRNLYTPIYNPLLHNCAMTIYEEFRVANGFQYKVMKDISPKLTKIPFADKRWNPLVYLSEPDAAEYAKIPRVVTEDQYKIEVRDDLLIKRMKGIEQFKEHIDNGFFNYLDKRYYENLLAKVYKDNNRKAKIELCELLSLLTIPQCCKEDTFSSNLSLQIEDIETLKLKTIKESPYKEEFFNSKVFSCEDVINNNLLFILSDIDATVLSKKKYKNEWSLRAVYIEQKHAISDWTIDVSSAF